MNRQTGFSLVEVLVALSLVAILGTTALLLLESTRRVSTQIVFEPPDPLGDIVHTMRRELDHLIPQPVPEELPGLTLDNGSHLSFTAHLTDGQGGRVTQKIEYLSLPEGLLRIHRPYLDSGSVTNRLDTLGTELTFSLRSQDIWTGDWPPEDNNGAGTPTLLRIHMSQRGETDHHDIFLPAYLRFEADPPGPAGPSSE